MEAIGSRWVKIPDRKVNRLRRNAGWPRCIASRGREMIEHPLCPLVHKTGPLPVVIVEQPQAASSAPTVQEFMMRQAGRLLYNQKSKCWMAFDGSGWEYILDREIDTLLCEISRDLSLVSLNKIRRALGEHVAFAVKEMS